MPKSKSTQRTSFSFLKFFFSLLLIIPSSFGTVTLVHRLSFFQFADLIQLACLTGVGVYTLMHLVLWRPIFIHVMGHELTHAFWAFVFGGRTKSLQVSSLGGQVTLSKTNFFVALAPYFFPFYTSLLIPFFIITAPKYQPLVSLLIGFTFAFHVALTLHSLREHQSDLQQCGVIFSVIFIYFMNLCMITLLLMLIAPAVIQPWTFLQETGTYILDFWNWAHAFWAQV
jgi:hypothetical protein